MSMSSRQDLLHTRAESYFRFGSGLTLSDWNLTPSHLFSSMGDIGAPTQLQAKQFDVAVANDQSRMLGK